MMGAPKKTYERVAPPYSFIHVDDYTTPKQLAKYLLQLGRFAVFVCLLFLLCIFTFFIKNKMTELKCSVLLIMLTCHDE